MFDLITAEIIMNCFGTNKQIESDLIILLCTSSELCLKFLAYLGSWFKIDYKICAAQSDIQEDGLI